MGFFSKIKEGLKKTRDAMMQSMQRVLNSFTKIDEELFEQLEETMIMGDMGVETSVEICDRLRKLVKERGVKEPAKIMDLIEEVIGDMMGEENELHLTTKPSVIMVIGVNGAGKTTTIGKMCHQFKQEGKKVIVAAADTFRAAAIEQLEVWTERAGVEIVKHAEGSDPAAVVFDSITAAIARECDIVIVDTAGRLHNKKNLMNELDKINRILVQKAEGCDIETLLVLDATTGQNAVNQAKLFSQVANITGIVLTKLDGTAKGGIVVSIKNELGIPVKLIGVGEKIDDLQPFNNRDFVRALFDRPEELDEEETQESTEISKDAEIVEDAPTVEEVSEVTEIVEDAPIVEEVPEVTEIVEDAPTVEEVPEVTEVAEDAPTVEEVPEVTEIVEDAPIVEEVPEVKEIVEDAPIVDEVPEVTGVVEDAPEEEKKKPFSWLFMEIGGKKKEEPAPETVAPVEFVNEETPATEESDDAPAETPEESPKEEKKPFAWLFTEIGGKKKDKKKED